MGRRRARIQVEAVLNYPVSTLRFIVIDRWIIDFSFVKKEREREEGFLLQDTVEGQRCVFLAKRVKSAKTCAPIARQNCIAREWHE